MSSRLPNWLRLPWRQRAKPPLKASVSAVRRQFGAVEIEPGMEGSCQAVERCRGERFLMSSAPQLPLQGCDLDDCHCRYVRLDDRRQDARRDADLGIEHRGVLAEERREQQRGRRRVDRR